VNREQSFNLAFNAKSKNFPTKNTEFFGTYVQSNIGSMSMQAFKDIEGKIGPVGGVQYCIQKAEIFCTEKLALFVHCFHPMSMVACCARNYSCIKQSTVCGKK
jgi:hypothetical protein